MALDFAWEPWFRPLLLEVRSWSAEFEPDAKGKALRIGPQQGGGWVSVHDRMAKEIDLHLPAPHRSSPALAHLKGTLAVIGPAKMWTVTFDRMDELAKGKQPRQSPEEGVSVTLKKLTALDADHWEVQVALSYPRGGPVFESHQNWLVNNRIYLEKGKGSKAVRFLPSPADERIEVAERDASSALVTYHFKERPNGVRLGNPADWRLVYYMPGRMVEVTAPFHFKDLPLP